MTVGEWFKPPQRLLAILFLLTLASVSTLAWFGWKLAQQENIVETQRTQERLEQEADRIVATLRANLAETGERLSTWAAAPPSRDATFEQGLLLILTPQTLTAYPARRLLYYPTLTPQPDATEKLFEEGERLEFTQDKPEKAEAIYARLADSKDSGVRAGALLRLGRVLRKRGRTAGSRAAYQRLAALGDGRVAGSPAELVARHALCELSASRDSAEDLKKDLLAVRWRLTQGQFEFYWSEASRLSGREEAPPDEAVALSQAAALAWSEWKRDSSPRGQRIVMTGERPWFLMWRSALGRRTVLVAKPESILKRASAETQALCAAVDEEGHTVAGVKVSSGRAAVRTAAENQLPWNLYVASSPSGRQPGAATRLRFVLIGIVIIVLVLIAGTYFIARAIRKEMEIARLQSDFVSAVSHEFRSPLTALRQLSEILAFGRVPSEERRQKYYETLVSETSRLQRLVETLLNFGKMEAGARQYRFEELDARELVDRVAAEFEPQISASGRHIGVDRAPNACRVVADSEALALALRNLVDNALKYSPDQPSVWVECGPENGCVAIRVRDRGIGIPLPEQKAIFEKFVRGNAAIRGSVKGTGVGLAMVRHVVDAHGGKILLASAPGEGSTFTMLLPALEKS